MVQLKPKRDRKPKRRFIYRDKKSVHVWLFSSSTVGKMNQFIYLFIFFLKKWLTFRACFLPRRAKSDSSFWRYRVPAVMPEKVPPPKDRFVLLFIFPSWCSSVIFFFFFCDVYVKKNRRGKFLEKRNFDKKEIREKEDDDEEEEEAEDGLHLSLFYYKLKRRGEHAIIFGNLQIKKCSWLMGRDIANYRNFGYSALKQGNLPAVPLERQVSRSIFRKRKTSEENCYQKHVCATEWRACIYDKWVAFLYIRMYVHNRCAQSARCIQ